MTWLAPRCHRNLSDPVTRFQVLGERNSGTNFVSGLLRENFPSLSDCQCFGWKHGFIDRRIAATPGLLTVIVYRHPLRWLQSLHRRPENLSLAMVGQSFSGFIRHEWQGVFRTRDGREELTQWDMAPGTTDQAFPNPIRLRNARIAYLEELAGMPARVAFLRFEDVNRRPREMVSALAAAFGLETGPFRPIVSFKGQQKATYRPRPMPPVSKADLEFIRAELDHDQEARLGYDLDAPPVFDGLPILDGRALRGLAGFLWRRAFGGGKPPAG